MKIGLVLQSGVELGGAHNYEANFQKLALEVAKDLGHEVATFVPYALKKQMDTSADIYSYKISPARFALAHIRANPLTLRALSLLGLGKTQLERKAIKLGVDILVFTSPNHLSPGIHTLPFTTTAWDFGHLDLPHYPETGQGGLWKWREHLYTSTAARSVAILCDSASTKLRLEQRYGVQPQRVNVIGLLPSVSSEVQKENFDKPHFIYPAMFWPHKDHFLLLESFADFLKTNGQVAYLVLTGSGQLVENVKKYAAELGIAESVKFLGLVSRDRLMALIAGSKGLLMASILGPTNIPPLEASMLGTPVVASDAHQMQDMLEGLELVPCSDRKAWTSAMVGLWRGEVKSPILLPANEKAVLVRALTFLENQLRGLSR
jgi:glycosyltransferase involved in cell wall biosynthesis